MHLYKYIIVCSLLKHIYLENVLSWHPSPPGENMDFSSLGLPQQWWFSFFAAPASPSCFAVQNFSVSFWRSLNYHEPLIIIPQLQQGLLRGWMVSVHGKHWHLNKFCHLLDEWWLFLMRNLKDLLKKCSCSFPLPGISRLLIAVNPKQILGLSINHAFAPLNRVDDFTYFLKNNPLYGQQILFKRIRLK